MICPETRAESPQNNQYCINSLSANANNKKCTGRLAPTQPFGEGLSPNGCLPFVFASG
ncbi:MAG: hypothetical protein LBU34_07590 [Planctomycetaceae bacterium]|nr:hypothetical protein [Planctomycetaceae bacterium]